MTAATPRARLRANKTTAKRTAAKKTTAKKTTAKKTAAKKTAAKRTAAKKTAAKRTAAKKTTAKKTTAKKTTAKKTAAKRTADKKTTAKRTASGKTEATGRTPAQAGASRHGQNPPEPGTLWLLSVPYEERKDASWAGARWNPTLKSWCYRGEQLPARLSRWAAAPHSWERYTQNQINNVVQHNPGDSTVTLRPHQQQAADAVEASANAGHPGFLLADNVGLGKAQPLSAQILTPTGYRRLGQLRTGDQVIAADGTPTTVLAIHPQGPRQCYAVRFDDGTTTQADSQHLWAVRNTAHNDTAHNDTAHNDTAHNDTAHNDTAHNDTAHTYTAHNNTAPNDIAPHHAAQHSLGLHDTYYTENHSESIGCAMGQDDLGCPGAVETGAHRTDHKPGAWRLATTSEIAEHLRARHTHPDYTQQHGAHPDHTQQHGTQLPGRQPDGAPGRHRHGTTGPAANAGQPRWGTASPTTRPTELEIPRAEPADLTHAAITGAAITGAAITGAAITGAGGAGQTGGANRDVEIPTEDYIRAAGAALAGGLANNLTTGPIPSQDRTTPDRLRRQMREDGAWDRPVWDARIPQLWLHTPAKVRSVLLTALSALNENPEDRRADTTRDVRHGTYARQRITVTGHRLAEDIAWLARSLGAWATITTAPGTPHRWAVHIDWARHRTIREIRPAGTAQMACISVAHPDGLYVTDNFTVTHNTYAAIEGVNRLHANTGTKANIGTKANTGGRGRPGTPPPDSAGTEPSGETGRPLNVLVISPLSVVAHWRRSIDTLGSPHNWCVINYDRLKTLLDTPQAALDAKRTRTRNKRIAAKGTSLVAWDVILADESHLLRNIGSQRTQAFRQLVKGHGQDAFVIWMSATAGQNPLELAYLAPLIAHTTGTKVKDLDDFETWCAQMGFGIRRGPFGSWQWDRNPDDLDTMRKLLFEATPIVGLRRRPTDIAGWPEQQRVEWPVELGATHRDLYDQAWDEFRAAMALDAGGCGPDPANALVAALRFRQKASLLRVDATAELADELVGSGLQVAISVQFLETADAIAEALSRKRIDTVVISGATGAAEREQARIAFQQGHVKAVIFTVCEGISLHAGERAVNATVAERALLVHDLRWSAIQMAQIEGRTHRDGQASLAYYLYAEDTVETKVAHAMLERLTDMADMMGDDTTGLDALLASVNLPDRPTRQAV